MRKIFDMFLSLLLIVGVLGCAYVLMNGTWHDEEPSVGSQGSSIEESIDNSNEESGEEDSSSEPVIEPVTTIKGLNIPENESELIAEGLQMQVGAQLALTDERAMRFTCDISTGLYNKVKADSNKSFGMLVIAQTYFDRVNTENYTYVDWITEFEKAGVTTYNYYKYETDTLPSNGNGYYMRYKLYDIPFMGINHPIVCIGVVATEVEGGTTYQYAAMPSGETYQSNARSIAYVASAALNANALGMESFSEDELVLIKSYVNESVDRANGLTSPTDDDSTFAFTTSVTTTQNLSVGQSITITTTISPEVKVPVWYTSSNESVVQVDENGKVTAKGKGTAVIGVYVAGEPYSITIKVS